jgi:hypothetical protein
MSDILRTWLCGNARCGQSFDSWERNPNCTACGCVRVSWVPGGGNVLTEACKTADTELRKLAGNFGLDNINSAQRDRRAMPALPPPPQHAGRNEPNMNFGQGFTAPLVRDQRGQPVATCLPSTSNVNFKARVGTGVALPHSRSVPGVHAATAIEASHRPPR